MNCLMILNPKIFCKNRITANLLWGCLVLGIFPLAASADVVGQDTATVKAIVENGIPEETLTVVQGPAFTAPAEIPTDGQYDYYYTEIPGILFWAAIGENWAVYLYFANVDHQIRNSEGDPFGNPLEDVAFGWELDPTSSDFVPPEDSNWHKDEGTYRRILGPPTPEINVTQRLADGESRVDENDPMSERKFGNIGSRPFVIAVRMDGVNDLVGQYEGTFTFDLRDKL